MQGQSFKDSSLPMRKRFYHGKPRGFRSKKQGGKKKELPRIIPGADNGLKPIFKKIGVPVKGTFSPDSFQTEAVEAIKTSDCLVTAPTGAGKTWIAEEAAKYVLDKNKKVWYATPLKALTNTIYSRFKTVFGKDSAGILTGDRKENSDAPIIIGTTEILRNQLYDAMHSGEDLRHKLVILDEAHYLGDPERGVVWEEILIYLPVRTSLLMLSATIGNPDQLAGWLETIRGKPCRTILETRRSVPLFPIFFHPSGTLVPLLKKNAKGRKNLLHKRVLKHLKTKHPPRISLPGRLPKFSEILKVLKFYDLLPAIFFLKSRADCDQAVRLCNEELISKEPGRIARLSHRIQELIRHTPHLEEHSQRYLLEHTATGSHHSGQLPAWKVLVETLMSEGLLDAMFATSTVAAGVNFPARSVVILNSDRFNGTEFLSLTPSEFQQMTGRAGRRGMDNIGFAILIPGKFMDLAHAARLVNAPSQDIPSQIKINFSMVLNLLLSHTPEQVRVLLKQSFASYMLTQGKRGKYARRAYGNDLEYLWQDFLAHLDFLKKHGFVTEQGALTQNGIWAANLRIDAPLMVAHCLMYNLLPEDDPMLLAAIMGAFVNEKEFDDKAMMQRLLPKRLTRTFLTLRKGLKPFALELMKGDFHAPNLFIQPAGLLFSWAGDEPWEILVSRTNFAEGDLARLILRTAENLRQMAGLTQSFPRIAASADEAMEMILKEPVVTYHD